MWEEGGLKRWNSNHGLGGALPAPWLRGKKWKNYVCWKFRNPSWAKSNSRRMEESDRKMQHGQRMVISRWNLDKWRIKSTQTFGKEKKNQKQFHHSPPIILEFLREKGESNLNFYQKNLTDRERGKFLWFFFLFTRDLKTLDTSLVQIYARYDHSLPSYAHFFKFFSFFTTFFEKSAVSVSATSSYFR